MSRGISANLSHLRKVLTSFSSCRLDSQLRCKHSENNYLYKMNEAYLRYETGADTFHFTFHYEDPDLKVNRQFNMVRKPAEPISHFLKRLDSNMTKALEKKKKKKKRSAKNAEENEEKVDNVESGVVALMRNDSKIGLDEPCETLFHDTSGITLRVYDKSYKIQMNVPWITSVALSASILADFPTYPIEFEAMHTDREKSTFTWYRNGSKAARNSKAYEEAWEEVGQGYVYTPSSADIECRLKLRCTPRNGEKSGPITETESTGVVEAGPGRCPFETRHSFTRDKLAGKHFRVTSYNILADVYASTEYSRDVLFPYCPPYALAIDYRKQLIVKELLGYNSDIICLQEVDRKVFNTDLFPILSMLNYGGVFDRKGADNNEGVATFYDERRFEKIAAESSVMSQNVALPGFQGVWERIGNEAVRERFLGRNTTVQATVLRSKENPEEILVVGNTHLYFQPDADHIRLLQGFYAITYCQEIARRTRENLASEVEANVRVVLCGDFNSTPDCGIYQLMTTMHVPEDHKDWKSNPEQIVENVSLSNDSKFGSACGTPEYTNFTVEFADCLDYIYYQTEGLEVTQVVPLPSKEELSLNGAIPSVVFPSDHVALCADLKWTSP